MSSNHVGELFGGQLGRPKGMGFGLTVEIVMDAPRAGMFLSEGSYGWDGAFGTRFWVDPKGELAAKIHADQDLGARVGLEHTPTIYIVKAQGPAVEVTDRAQLFNMIDQAMREAGATADASDKPAAKKKTATKPAAKKSTTAKKTGQS